MKRMQLNDEISIGGQPAEGDFAELKEAGFKSVVNLRTDGEEDQPLSTTAEADLVRAEGMEYLSFPVGGKSMDAEHADEFRELLPKLPTPVYIHCRGGKRAGVMAMIHLGCQQGLSGDHVLEQAEDRGFECDSPKLRQFLKKYVDEHQER